MAINNYGMAEYITPDEAAGVVNAARTADENAANAMAQRAIASNPNPEVGRQIFNVATNVLANVGQWPELLGAAYTETPFFKAPVGIYNGVLYANNVDNDRSWLRNFYTGWKDTQDMPGVFEDYYIPITPERSAFEQSASVGDVVFGGLEAIPAIRAGTKAAKTVNRIANYGMDALRSEAKVNSLAREASALRRDYEDFINNLPNSGARKAAVSGKRAADMRKAIDDADEAVAKAQENVISTGQSVLNNIKKDFSPYARAGLATYGADTALDGAGAIARYMGLVGDSAPLNKQDEANLASAGNRASAIMDEYYGIGNSTQPNASSNLVPTAAHASYGTPLNSTELLSNALVNANQMYGDSAALAMGSPQQLEVPESAAPYLEPNYGEEAVRKYEEYLAGLDKELAKDEDWQRTLREYAIEQNRIARMKAQQEYDDNGWNVVSQVANFLMRGTADPFEAYRRNRTRFINDDPNVAYWSDMANLYGDRQSAQNAIARRQQLTEAAAALNNDYSLNASRRATNQVSMANWDALPPYEKAKLLSSISESYANTNALPGRIEAQALVASANANNANARALATGVQTLLTQYYNNLARGVNPQTARNIIMRNPKISNELKQAFQLSLGGNNSTQTSTLLRR